MWYIKSSDSLNTQTREDLIYKEKKTAATQPKIGSSIIQETRSKGVGRSSWGGLKPWDQSQDIVWENNEHGDHGDNREW